MRDVRLRQNSRVLNAVLEQLPCDLGIEIDRVQQLLLFDVLAFGVRHVNRARTDQHGLPQLVSAGMSVVNAAIMVSMPGTVPSP